VRDNARAAGVPVKEIGVLPSGVIDLTALEAALGALGEEDGTPILALMLANNETGVIQPVAEAAGMMRAGGGLTHCDAVQALGKIKENVLLLGAVNAAGQQAWAPCGCGGGHL